MSKISKYFNQHTHAASLAIFRIATGLMLFLSISRFWYMGWVEELYIKPTFFFSFYGFEFIKPIGNYIYILFVLSGICALFVALGWFYRIAICLLFLSFTYIELMDKSTYLNHYYFTSLILFLMIFLPANRYFSLDVWRDKKMLAEYIPRWCTDAIKLMVFILYFYAGLAKLNSDWLLHALPLKIWLPARNDMPIIGWLFNYTLVPFLFSWVACIYDLSIAFLLWNKKTRLFAYASVVIFHLLTAALFPIGMFPYIMIVTALIFFSKDFHLQIITTINRVFKTSQSFIHPQTSYFFKKVDQSVLRYSLTIFFLIQIILPFRYILYPGELFWTEQGYRFSWRVMLIEKAGYAQFTIKDTTGKMLLINNTDFLTPLQEKMMSTQPDFILQYAHFLRDHYKNHGFTSPQIYADVYVALNGRMGQNLVNPETDLAKEQESFKNKSWILPLNDDIKGF